MPWVRNEATGAARQICGVCWVELRDAGLSEADMVTDAPEAEERYSLGIYAGTYCDPHWKASGYRDEPASGFDPFDAGESYDPD